MDAKNIEKLVQKAKDDILKEVNDRLPRKVGVVAVNHFKQNFRDGGWLDNGLHPWQRTRRQDSNSPDANLFFFFKKVWLFQEKAVHLYY